MPAITQEQHRRFLLRSDLARLEIPEDTVADWLGSGSVELIGAVDGDDGGDAVFAVHSVDLRQELKSRLQQLGKDDVAMLPVEARALWMQVLLADRGITPEPASAPSAEVTPEADDAGSEDMFSRHAAEEDIDATIDSISEAIGDLMEPAYESAGTWSGEPAAEGVRDDGSDVDEHVGEDTDLPMADRDAVGHDAVELEEQDATPTWNWGLPVDLSPVESIPEIGDEAVAAESEDTTGEDEWADLDDDTQLDRDLDLDTLSEVAGRTPHDERTGSATAGTQPDREVGDADRGSDWSPPEDGEEVAPLTLAETLGHDLEAAAHGKDAGISPAVTDDDAADDALRRLEIATEAMATLFGDEEDADHAHPPSPPTPARPLEPPFESSFESSFDESVLEATLRGAPDGDTAARELAARATTAHVDLSPLREPLQRIHDAVRDLRFGPPGLDGIEAALRELSASLPTRADLADVVQRLDRMHATAEENRTALLRAAAGLASAQPRITGPVAPPPQPRRSQLSTLLGIGLMVGGWVGALWLHTGDPRAAMLALIVANAFGGLVLLMRRG